METCVRRSAPPLPFLWSQNLNTPCPTDMSPPAGLQQFQVSLLTGLPSKQCLLAGKWQIGSCTITVIHKRLFPGAFYKRLKKNKKTQTPTAVRLSQTHAWIKKKEKNHKAMISSKQKKQNKSKHIYQWNDQSTINSFFKNNNLKSFLKNRVKHLIQSDRLWGCSVRVDNPQSQAS